MKNKDLQKRLLALLLALLSLLPMAYLAACTQPEDGGVSVPSGMKNATAGAEGYLFFVPDGWLVERVGNVTVASISAYSSVTFSLAVFPSERSAVEYFTASRPDVEQQLSDFALAEDGEKVSVGGVAAVRYVFSGKYVEDKLYHVMQYITKKDGHLYVFTYTANDSEFDSYKTAIETAVGHFRFTEKPLNTPTPVPPADDAAPAGMQLISDSTIHAFSLYVPQGWTVDTRGGVCGAYFDADRASVSLTCMYPPSGVRTLYDFFEVLQPIYGRIYQNYTVLSKAKEGDPVTKIGGYDGAVYLMQGESGGEVFKIKQVNFVRDSHIYVFTYTARADVFDAHMAEVDGIIAAITFP